MKTVVMSYLRTSLIQNRIEQFGSLRFAAFQASLLGTTFAKGPHLHKPNFNLKITVKSVFVPRARPWPWPYKAVAVGTMLSSFV